MANQKNSRPGFDYYFVRHREYAEALKEADEYYKNGWTLTRWDYEPTTMTFVFLLQRPKDYVQPDAAQEAEKK